MTTPTSPTCHVGFTGTRHGMTTAQTRAVRALLTDLQAHHGADVFHHGDCIGADDQAATVAHDLGFWVVAHPPTNRRVRAYGYYDELRCPAPYLARNRAIVDACHRMIACPATAMEEQRSGTWSTIRYARRRGVRMAVLSPHQASAVPA